MDSLFATDKYPPLMVSRHDTPERMESEQYLPLLKKYWNIDVAIELVKTTTVYTPTHKFESCG